MAENNIHKNTFDGGLNTDLAPAIINQNQYIDANNVTLIGSGQFLALQNVRGTLKIKDLNATTNTTTILRAVPCKYKVGTSEGLDGITIFSHEEDPVGTSNLFKISAYVFSTDTLYNIYSETVGDDYLVTASAELGGSNERVIDGALYPENNLDIIYFTDFYNRPRKLRCEIPVAYAGSAFLTADDLELLRKPALGKLVLDSTNGVTTGGSLLTGTYQLAYQLFNEDTNQYTGFSLLTTPIHIYNSATNVKNAGFGMGSNKKITVDITPTEDEATYYTHFRIAVVENIGTADSINVGVTPFEALSLSGGIQQNVEITSNQQYSFTTIDDIVVDLAAIQCVKTLTIKENRLLLGNIINESLTYDNGDPTVDTTPSTGSAVLIATNTTNSAESELFQSTKRGYFRDEVYRFAISYFDENGYFSSPKVLDLSGIDYNQISGAVDVKFPARSYSEGGVFFSIMNDDDDIQNLGLSLVDITNHPSWSKGFVILRAKRKKNIMFQTPIVPMAKLAGLGAVQNYPTEYAVGSGLTITTNTDLEPMGPSSTFVPYNMFYGSPSQSPRLISVTGGVGDDAYYSGEAEPLQFMTSAELAMIFPSDTMYSSTPYTFTGSEAFKTVDAIICETDWDRFDSAPYNPGVGAGTSISATFFATRDEQHFFHDGHAKSVSTLRSSNVPISSTRNIDNYAEGGDFNGVSILDYSKVMTNGVQFGTAPNNQRGTVVGFNAPILNGVSAPSFKGLGPVTARIQPNETSIAAIGSLPNTLYTNLYGFLENSNADGFWEIERDGANGGGWNVTASPNLYQDGVGTTGDYDTVTTGGTANFGGGRTVALVTDDVVVYDGFAGVWRTTADSDYGFRVKSNPIEICNVVKGLNDTRYGDVDTYNEFIFTGAKHIFTNSEVTNNTRADVSLEVWGGDCIVSPHTFKISDSTYTVINSDKYVGTGHGVTPSTVAGNYNMVWLDIADTAVLSMPYFYKNVGQYLTVILESEYNGAIVDHTDSDYMHTDALSGVKVIGAPTEEKVRYCRPYLYNTNLNKENDQRIFVPVDALADTITKYKSRVLYSDLKIYQTDIDGFNVVRVGNTYDLPETYGALTKLAVSGDKLYALQHQGIAMLPVGERVIETTDASQLAVRSGEFLGQALYLDTQRGCQHIGTVVNNGQMLYFMDVANKAVGALAGGLQIISGNGLSTSLRTLLASPVPERALIAAFDNTRDQYYIARKYGSNRFVYVWNEGLKKWEANLEFPSLGFGDAVSIYNKFVIIGNDTTNNYSSIHEAHAGNYSQFMGTYVEPDVTFVVNPIVDIAKVYDALLINTSAPSGSMSADVLVPYLGGTRTTSIDAFSTVRGEGNYKVKIGRDTTGGTDVNGDYIRRMRGPYAEIKMKWGYDTVTTRSVPVYLSSVLTKFRPSANSF